MLCRESLPKCRVEIIASDIDRKAISEASKGAYSDHIVGRTPEKYMPMFRRHASRNGDGRWHVNEAIRKTIHFKSENILEARYTGLDLALCRNVMIYFDKASIERMVEVLVRSLRVGGVLVVGDSEYLACERPDLARERLGRTTVYRKLKAGRRS